jgi:type I restriction enzyme S subunit
MPHDTANTIRLLRSNNVQDSFVKTAELKHVNSKRVATHQILTRDDIVICMANGSKALVGKTGRFQVSDGYEYTFGAFMGCFRTIPAKADPGFAFYLLQTDRYQRLIGDLLAGSSINSLKPSSLESLEFLFPERSEQQAIAAVLSDIDAELTYLTHRRDSIQEIKQGMMQQLLTGKIRLT